MAVALFEILIWLPAIIGWGGSAMFVRRALSGSASSWLSEALFGMMTLATLTALLNFVWPINGLIGWGLLLLGWGLCGWRAWRQDLPRLSAWQAFVAALVLLFIAWGSSRAAFTYDTGLYYAQTIKWFNESTLPLGLGNLHGRLAFNSSWLALAALLRATALFSFDYFSLSALLLCFYALEIICTRSPFLIFSAIAFLSIAARVNVSSPAPDLPVLILTLFLIHLARETFAKPEHIAYAVAHSLILSVFAISIKLSSVPLMFIPLSLVVFAFRQRLVLKWRRLMWVTGAATIVIGGVWLMRGVWISGCVLYPISLTCLPSLSWSVPVVTAEIESQNIIAWARLPHSPAGVVLADNTWLLNWLPRIAFSPDVWIMFPLLIGGLTVLIRRPFSQAVGWIALPLVGGLFYWFATAPDLRFGAGYLWGLALALWSAAWERWALATRRVLDTLLACWFILSASLLAALTWQPDLLRVDAASLMAPRLMPSSETQIRRGINGIQVFVPTHTDQCWNAPLPCTPLWRDNLEILRSPTGEIKMFYVR